MNILRVIFKANSLGNVVDVNIPETDLAATIEEYLPKISKREKTVITIQPMGTMKDIYITSKYLPLKNKAKTDIVSPF